MVAKLRHLNHRLVRSSVGSFDLLVEVRFAAGASSSLGLPVFLTLKELLEVLVQSDFLLHLRWIVVDVVHDDLLP